jgi:hypothetical protein
LYGRVGRKRENECRDRIGQDKADNPHGISVNDPATIPSHAAARQMRTGGLSRGKLAFSPAEKLPCACPTSLGNKLFALYQGTTSSRAVEGSKRIGL